METVEGVLALGGVEEEPVGFEPANVVGGLALGGVAEELVEFEPVDVIGGLGLGATEFVPAVLEDVVEDAGLDGGTAEALTVDASPTLFLMKVLISGAAIFTYTS